MDLKVLLLHSISTGKLIRTQKIVRFGKKCFSIAYELDGKFLSVKAIKQVSKRRTLRERVEKKRMRLWHKSSPRSLQSKLHLDGDDVDFKSTDFSMFECKETETETTIQWRAPVAVYHVEQQTVATETCMQGTQYDCATVCAAVQTELPTMSSLQQTESHTGSTQTQTLLEHSNCQVQTDLQEHSESMQIEQEAVILLLNEIGEMIINQDHLLHNNSTLLGQISEMMMLKRVIEEKSLTNKHHNKFQLLRRNLPKRSCGNYPNVCLCKRRRRQISCTRSKATQTAAATIDEKCTQTSNELKKKKSCFRIC